MGSTLGESRSFQRPFPQGMETGVRLSQGQIQTTEAQLDPKTQPPISSSPVTTSLKFDTKENLPTSETPGCLSMGSSRYSYHP